MRQFLKCCFTSRASSEPKSNFKSRPDLQESIDTMDRPSTSNSNDYFHDTMDRPSTSNANDYFQPEKLNEEWKDSSTETTNIILNPDFSQGLHMWLPNSCDAVVASSESGYPQGLSTKLSGCFAVVNNRKESWHGLEQDITSRVTAGPTYTVCCLVATSGAGHGVSDVLATLKLEYRDSSVSYLSIGRTSASTERWEKVEGTFSISAMPQRVIFYLEGPSCGIDLLIKSVLVSGPSSTQCNKSIEESKDSIIRASNVILNHDFSRGLETWHPNGCDAFVVSSESEYAQGLSANLSGCYAVVTNRKESWQGLEQDITNRISAGPTYTVCAWVAINGAGQNNSDVLATMKFESEGSPVSYLFLGRATASNDHWIKVEGTFSLPTLPHRVIFYLEGPSSGIDLLIRSVIVSCTSTGESGTQGTPSLCIDDGNIIQNPRFDDGLNNWTARGCQIAVHDSMDDGKILPLSGKFFASTQNRTQNWNGIQQEITGRAQRKLAYEVVATVRIFGNNISTADVRATLWVQAADLREQYIGIGSAQATDKDWSQLQGKFLINGTPSRVVLFIEGPPPGTDILLDNLVVKHAAKPPPAYPPSIENPAFGVNIVANSHLSDGTNGWFPLGNCNLSVKNGAPRILPPMAADSLGAHEALSGRYILVTGRTQTWMGPAQMITDKVKLYLSYQVSAWVKIGSGATRPQGLNVALGVDSQWVNGGQVEIDDDKWHEIGGSFRIEKQPAKIMIYIQGPDPGVDVMVSGLQIFPVDRHTRFRHLKKQTEKIRKRDVTLKFTSSGSDTLVGSVVKIQQTQNTFPFGTCISRSVIDNEDFVDFFTRNFNWTVFENELKWYWTEAQRGNLNYKEADEMLNLCTLHNIQLRGHCIFWEVEGAIQSWIRSLSRDDMMAAVQSRVTSLLTRYKGKFKHYDVNNEMLHGSFFQDHLGKDIRANMFKTANQLDPSATLFVNDYHVEDGCDTRSSPEKYIQHILDLQEQGAPVGGIGIQGHTDCPVGPIVCSALDKLGILGLPVWFTEVDVSSDNEYVRADDLEVLLREAFAHPAVEGVVFWGIWELFMSRGNAHLVNAEGDVNEAGKRYLALKKEWLSKAHGRINDQGGYEFRGFHGSYVIEIDSPSKNKVVKTFVVEPGEDPLVISINL